MPNLFHRLSFGLIGGATFGDGLVHHIGDLSQPRVGVRTLGKSCIETRFIWFRNRQFIVHVTALFIHWLDLYNPKIALPPSSFDLHFQSHPHCGAGPTHLNFSLTPRH